MDHMMQQLREAAHREDPMSISPPQPANPQEAQTSILGHSKRFAGSRG